MATETLMLDPADDVAATNLYTNPSGESSVKWSDFADDWAITREISSTTVPAFRGLYRDKHAFDGSFSGNNVGALPITFPAAGTYVVSTYIWIPANYDGTAPRLEADSYTGGIGETRTAASLLLRDQWQRIWTTITVVGGDLVGFFTMRLAGAAPSSAPTGILYTDAVQVETGSTPTDYFSGDTEGDCCSSRYAWTGTAHASTSTRVNERAELAIESATPGAGPITVKEGGVDWGDAKVAAYNAEGRYGEVPIDFRQANREVSIPLILHGTSFDTARAQLQQKVGLFQREGGQLRRTFRDGRVLYLDIVGASLKLGGSRGAALHDIDADAVLVLETLPDWYGPWVYLDPIVETTEAEIVGLLKQNAVTAAIEGDMPGRCRIRIHDLQGADQLGVLAAFRCRHYDPASTAALEYEAEALDSLDTAAVATVTGASGGASNNVVAHTNLGTNWTPVLGTNVGGTSYLTHVGSYRVWARLRSPSGDAVTARWVYDVGDLTLPEENDPWTFPAADQFYIADLGEMRLDRAPSGAHRWGGQIQAMGETGGEDVEVDKVWFQPLDDWAGRGRAPVNVDIGLADYAARDEFNQSAGSLSGKTAAIGGAWSGAGDSDDFAVNATDKVARRSSGEDASQAPHSGRIAIVGSAMTASVAQVDFKVNASSSTTRRGLLLRYADTSNYFEFSHIGVGPETTVEVNKRVAGTTTELVHISGVAAVNPLDTWIRMRAVALASGYWWLWLFTPGATPGDPIASGYDSSLATGGSLASGKATFYDNWSSATVATRDYDNFAAWVPTSDAAIFASRYADLSTNGLRRLDSTGTAPGPISLPIGPLPRIPASGMEARPVELFVKATRGDLDTIPGTAVDDIAAQVSFRPSWAFAPSADG